MLMTEWIFLQAEAAARLLLQRFWEAHPGLVSDYTPVDVLTKWLALDVADFQAGDHALGTFGYIDPDEDEHLIWLRDDLATSLRRFTLAHELGHALLHCRGNQWITAFQQELAIVPLAQRGPQFRIRTPQPSLDDPCSASDVQDSLTAYYEQQYWQEQLGQGHVYDPRSQHEIAANVFAAELLMPLERLRHVYLVERAAPHLLTTRFGVSQAALLTRLHDLLSQETDGGRDTALPTTPVGTAVGGNGKKIHPHYDEFQRVAIEAPTPALITAGPGSGKTSTLIGRVEYLVHTCNVHPQQILALTFSRKAAQEMAERLRQLLGQENAALPTVSTFHAFCADLLRRYGSLVGLRPDFALIDEAEGYFTLHQVANTLQLRHYQNLFMPDMYFNVLLQAIARAKDELVTPQAYAELAQHMLAAAQDDEAQVRAERALEVAHVYSVYDAALRQRGDTDFGGLLVLTIELLRTQSSVLQELQQQYQHILVDEFQDMNRASGVLLRELAGIQRRVWVVGDQNQAIYGFRGASPANMGNFQQDFPGAVTLPLSRNYRSRPDLVQLAETFRCALLTKSTDTGKNQPVRPNEHTPYVTLAMAAHEVDEIAGIVQDIRSRHESGNSYRDLVVLCRTRTQVQKITRALLKAGLPVAQQSGLLEQEHIKDVLSIVLLLVDQSGMGLLRAARVPAHPLSQADVEALLCFAREQQRTPLDLLLNDVFPPTLSKAGMSSLHHLKELMQHLQRAQDLWSLLSSYFFLETSLMQDLLQQSAYTEVRAHLNEYKTLLQLALHYDRLYQARVLRMAVSENSPLASAEPSASVDDLQLRIRGFLEYLRVLVELRQDSGERQAGGSDDEEEQRDELRVMTVHASKGLEFPVVYLPGLVNRRFPLQSRSTLVPPPIGMLSPESEDKTTHERDEAYLFYVGLTRARDHVVLSRSERYGKVNYKPSLFLEALTMDLPAERFGNLHWTTGDAHTDDEADDAMLPYGHPDPRFITAMKPIQTTVGALESYLRCPRRYAYEQIYHFASEEQTYQIFWQAVQKTVEVASKQATQTRHEEQRLLTAEQMQELYGKHWQDAGGPDARFATMYEQHGREVIELVRQELARAGVWRLRPAYEVKIVDTMVSVTVDRLEQPTQAGMPLRFVRTRYGKRKEQPAADLRDLLYVQASRQHHPGQEVELHSHNMSTGERVPLTIGKKKEQNLLADAAGALAGIARDAYPASPADVMRCPACPFFFICPA